MRVIRSRHKHRARHAGLVWFGLVRSVPVWSGLVCLFQLPLPNNDCRLAIGFTAFRGNKASVEVEVWPWIITFRSLYWKINYSMAWQQFQFRFAVQTRIGW